MSLIEWTNKSWNPTTGCDKVTRGCRFCYAERISERNHKRGVSGYENGFDFTLHPHRLEKPKQWKSGQYVFVNSMSDLFHERCPDEYIYRVFGVMNDADRHVYQVLTKRAERLSKLGPYLPWDHHIWAGVSVESAEETGRIDQLRECGADVKWISAEPMVGSLGDVDLTGIDWVVMGGESGDVEEIADLNLEWMRHLIRKCREQDVTPYVKQLGEVWSQKNDASRGHGGDPREWPQDLRVREVPDVVTDQPSLTTLGA